MTTVPVLTNVKNSGCRLGPLMFSWSGSSGLKILSSVRFRRYMGLHLAILLYAYTTAYYPSYQETYCKYTTQPPCIQHARYKGALAALALELEACRGRQLTELLRGLIPANWYSETGPID